MMGICQWIVIVLWGLRLFASLTLDGQEMLDKEGKPLKYSFSRHLAQVAIAFILLYFGGFFNAD